MTSHEGHAHSCEKAIRNFMKLIHMKYLISACVVILLGGLPTDGVSQKESEPDVENCQCISGYDDLIFVQLKLLNENERAEVNKKLKRWKLSASSSASIKVWNLHDPERAGQFEIMTVKEYNDQSFIKQRHGVILVSSKGPLNSGKSKKLRRVRSLVQVQYAGPVCAVGMGSPTGILSEITVEYSGTIDVLQNEPLLAEHDVSIVPLYGRVYTLNFANSTGRDILDIAKEVLEIPGVTSIECSSFKLPKSPID